MLAKREESTEQNNRKTKCRQTYSHSLTHSLVHTHTHTCELEEQCGKETRKASPKHNSFFICVHLIYEHIVLSVAFVVYNRHSLITVIVISFATALWLHIYLCAVFPQSCTIISINVSHFYDFRCEWKQCVCVCVSTRVLGKVERKKKIDSIFMIVFCFSDAVDKVCSRGANIDKPQIHEYR